ncbi:E3 ubiquitin-protein ligase complex slx8-rfp subunit-like protein [Hapsidospora chrysogenum ATCC 11550]|uniref:E3 ubiquitin-protein ligase complex slx8-rfp subunit-like protein n=1 Tax=Hapsidospora chrysogenum (strain ATCC 11550 / CBS 779.69 / DSM 880 / IAM 14645 / JCM 23072 / IMI 49137) TaxID=857340 RepID=A0A086T1H8_HAPC1|nr:E3 ubiquitin-protein ligase complex slx8-rfp subunit-like protein [Hapsidospora chrysogenum ATCC 11550]
MSLDLSLSSSSPVVDATRPTSPNNRPHNSLARLRSPSGSRGNHRNQPVLEPPVAGRNKTSSSPRLHSTSSPSEPRRTATDSQPNRSSDDPAVLVTGSSAPLAHLRPRRLTPQRHSSPPPLEWPEDNNDSSLPSLVDNDVFASAGWSPHALNYFYTSDDHFLSDLANGDFSSPSTYPPFTHPHQLSSPSGQGRHHHEFRPQSRTSTAAQAAAPRSLSSLLPSTPQNPASASFDSTRSFVTETSGGSFHDTSQSSLGSDEMPSATRRQSGPVDVVDLDTVHGAAPTHRRRTSTATTQTSPAPSVNRAHKRPKFNHDDDPFGDEPTVAEKVDDALYMIDLTKPGSNVLEDKDAAESSKDPPEEDKRTKLASFQCVICMDDAKVLTATHCGHLYCAQCLHSSLYVESTKGKCPMCRAKIDLKPRSQYTHHTKGFYPLELKFTTRSRNGKRKASGIH